MEVQPSTPYSVPILLPTCTTLHKNDVTLSMFLDSDHRLQLFCALASKTNQNPILDLTHFVSFLWRELSHSKFIQLVYHP